MASSISELASATTTRKQIDYFRALFESTIALALFALAVLAFNFLGDGMRDAADPDK